MHGSSYNGDCSQALRDLDIVMKELWGGEEAVIKNMSL